MNEILKFLSDYWLVLLIIFTVSTVITLLGYFSAKIHLDCIKKGKNKLYSFQKEALDCSKLFELHVIRERLYQDIKNNKSHYEGLSIRDEYHYTLGMMHMKEKILNIEIKDKLINKEKNG